MKRLPNVEFSKAGWRQFAAMNRNLGSRFIKGFILRHKLAEYIGAHYESGNLLDPYCQELRYEDGVYLILQQIGSTWYVTDVWTDEIPAAYAPVLFWKRVKRGWREMAARVLIGWRPLKNKTYIAKNEVPTVCAH